MRTINANWPQQLTPQSLKDWAATLNDGKVFCFIDIERCVIATWVRTKIDSFFSCGGEYFCTGGKVGEELKLNQYDFPPWLQRFSLILARRDVLDGKLIKELVKEL